MRKIINYSVICTIYCLAFLSPVVAQEKMTRVITTHMPPYSINEGFFRIGAIMDIVQEMRKIVGRSYQVEFLPWKRAQKEVIEFERSKGNAVIFPLGRTAKREEDYRWIVKIITDPIALHAVKNIPITSYEDVKDLKVGVLTSSSGLQLLKKAKFTDIYTCANVVMCAKMLNAGRIDVWLAPGLVAPYVFDKLEMNIDRLKYGYVLKYMDFYLAGAKEMPDNKVLLWLKAYDLLKAQGRIEQILENYQYTGY
ncbi:putative Amino acid ABC transporter substrate-binding protein [Candidatus Terasakiella magnetica]|uniref:Putative Amino acid ABC transporter substrate-binding protein n=1 Tax=Candidatus Terasakiella magnetica TaxID=1867952 RepID=A0A1C3RFE6_9PROT|nr:ABC transporter substrate-binding protein [Candidatus Terasakiella magnetica]SCA56016.1 putative Amino acid ABC transporter substrate-binding protein [Candidatus Terasakiella magnetica]